MNIFDLVQSNQITAYWETLVADEVQYPGEELFPADKKMGLDLSWIKGSKGLPVVLNTSAFDVHAIPRPRVGFDELKADMPFFKESTYISEKLRQELNLVLATGNQAYIDSVMNKVFDDEMRLLRGARAARERMRIMAISTGAVTMNANGMSYTFDYGMPADHKVTVTTSWSNPASDPLKDIDTGKEKILQDTGAVITRAMCDSVTWRNLKNNEKIIKSIYARTEGTVSITDKNLKEFIMDTLQIDVAVNNLMYKDEKGQSLKYMPSNTFVLLPDGELGNTWFGTTPAESDLMSQSATNVSITDTGVAVVTTQKTDPVQVESIVSMICLPSFEAADEVYILDTEA